MRYICLGVAPGCFERQRGQLAQLAMWTLRSGVVSECTEPHPCRSERSEAMQIQAFVAHRAVQAFLRSVLPWVARRDVPRLDATLCPARLHCTRDDRGTVVASSVPRRAMRRTAQGQHAAQAVGRGRQGDGQRQRFTRERRPSPARFAAACPPARQLRHSHRPKYGRDTPRATARGAVAAYVSAPRGAPGADGVATSGGYASG